MNPKKILLIVIGLLFNVEGMAQVEIQKHAVPFSDYRISSDQKGIMRSSTNMPWTRVDLAKGSMEDDLVQFVLRIECDGMTGGVIFDDASFVVFQPKSTSRQEGPNQLSFPLAVWPANTSFPNEKKRWNGITRVQFSNDTAAFILKPLPVHEYVSAGQSTTDTFIKALSMRLNKESTSVYFGSAKAISKSISSSLNSSLYDQDFAKPLHVEFLSESGRVKPFSFDLSKLEAHLALALNRKCGNH